MPALSALDWVKDKKGNRVTDHYVFLMQEGDPGEGKFFRGKSSEEDPGVFSDKLDGYELVDKNDLPPDIFWHLVNLTRGAKRLLREYSKKAAYDDPNMELAKHNYIAYVKRNFSAPAADLVRLMKNQYHLSYRDAWSIYREAKEEIEGTKVSSTTVAFHERIPISRKDKEMGQLMRDFLQWSEDTRNRDKGEQRIDLGEKPADEISAPAQTVRPVAEEPESREKFLNKRRQFGQPSESDAEDYSKSYPWDMPHTAIPQLSLFNEGIRLKASLEDGAVPHTPVGHHDVIFDFEFNGSKYSARVFDYESMVRTNTLRTMVANHVRILYPMASESLNEVTDGVVNLVTGGECLSKTGMKADPSNDYKWSGVENVNDALSTLQNKHGITAWTAGKDGDQEHVFTFYSDPGDNLVGIWNEQTYELEVFPPAKSASVNASQPESNKMFDEAFKMWFDKNHDRLYEEYLDISTREGFGFTSFEEWARREWGKVGIDRKGD